MKGLMPVDGLSRLKSAVSGPKACVLVDLAAKLSGCLWKIGAGADRRPEQGKGEAAGAQAETRQHGVGRKEMRIMDPFDLQMAMAMC